MNATIGALLGLAVAGGVTLLTFGLQPQAERVKPDRIKVPLAHRLRTTSAEVRNALLGGAVGLVFAVIIGMPALVIVCAALGLTAPPLFGKPPTTKALERTEAVETWVRGLTGMLHGGIGIEDAIRTSLPSTPAAIRPEVARLVARLRAQQPVETALRNWADEMDNRVSDLVASALIMGADTRRGGLSQALEDLSASVSQQTRTLQRIEADRAGTRSATRIIAGISVGMFTFIILSPIGAPYRDLLGQLVLIVFAAAYAGILRWMHVLSQGKTRPRFLSTPRGESAGVS